MTAPCSIMRSRKKNLEYTTQYAIEANALPIADCRLPIVGYRFKQNNL
jgi:hypothetical protein